MDHSTIPTVNGVPVSLVGHTHTLADFPNPLIVNAIKSATQTYVANTTTKLTFSSAPIDPAGLFVPASSRILLAGPIHGLGIFCIDCALILNSTSTMYIYVYKNGINIGTMLYRGVADSYFSGSFWLTLVQDDYVELWIRGATGRTIQTTTNMTFRQLA